MRSGGSTLDFSGAERRAVILGHPRILTNPQRQARGAKTEVVPNKGEQNPKWLPHPNLLWAQKRAVMLGHPYILRDPQRQARGAKAQVAPPKGNKMRCGYLTAAFSEAQRRAVMLSHPCGPWDPKDQGRRAKSEVIAHKREQNQKWLPHPCLVGGSKEGGNTRSPLHSWGSPTPSAGSKIRSGPHQRGTQSEVAASPLPSWGPKRGR